MITITQFQHGEEQIFTLQNKCKRTHVCAWSCGLLSRLAMEKAPLGDGSLASAEGNHSLCASFTVPEDLAHRFTTTTVM